MDLRTLQQELALRDDGVLRYGSHNEGREFCALEFESAVRGRAWSDAPITMPDLRPINDGFGYGAAADHARTAAVLPVLVALWDWPHWDAARQQRWITRVVVQTVVQVIAALPGLSPEIRSACRGAVTLQEAEAAAEAARAAEAAAARAAPEAEAARAAEAAAARAAAEAAGYTVLGTACAIWIEAAAYSVVDDGGTVLVDEAQV